MGASYVAKRFQERRCGHPTKKAKPAAECILSLVGEDRGYAYNMTEVLSNMLMCTANPDKGISLV